MAIVDRNICVLAVYEMFILLKYNYVTINEAIEISKTFGSNESGAFINGILDKIAVTAREKIPGKQDKNQDQPWSIDTVCCDTAVISYFQDEKPLERSSGLIDWRSNGYLSRLLISNKIQGEFAETLLYIRFNKVKPEKILMIGLGKSLIMS